MTCNVETCERSTYVRGYCTMHYQRLRQFGDAEHDPRDPQRRFWSKVDKQRGGCWVWVGAIADTGYGVFNVGNCKNEGAHRVAYRWLVGPIPEGLHLDHLCKNRACCNPEHLEPVTPRENSHRGKRIGHFNGPQTCHRGHDWSVTPPYLAHRSDGSVSRRCRVCHNDLLNAKRGVA